ncbi:MAG: PAS domain S-box protein [Planctomycetales bacterium]|nr:PAS domain S-box protein [Planctomycetales bacterium]
MATFVKEADLLLAEIDRLRQRVSQLEQQIDVNGRTCPDGNAEISLSTIDSYESFVKTSGALEHLAAATTPVTGNDFFAVITEHLAKAFNVDFVIVTEILEEPNNSLRTLGIWARNPQCIIGECSFEKTPCQLAIQLGEYHCVSNVCDEFPDNAWLRQFGFESYFGVKLPGRYGDPLGSLCILNKDAFQVTPVIRTVMRLFANRAAMELERMRSDDQIRESESRFRAIFDTEPECVKLLDKNGILLNMNAAGLRLIEADSIDSVQGECIYPLVVPEHREAFITENEAAFAGVPGVLQFEIVGLRGARRWMESHHVPLNNSSGETTAVLAVTRDITEWKQAIENLDRSEARLRALVEVIPDLIFRLDEAGIFIDFKANPAEWERYLPTEGFLGGHYRNILPTHVADMYEVAARKARETQQVQSYEYDQVLPDGRRQDYEARVINAEDGGHVVVVRNITEQKQMQADRRLFRDICDHASEAFFVIDQRSSKFLDVNSTAINSLGYSREELLTMEVDDIEFDTSGVDSTSWAELFSKVESQGRLITHRIHCRKDGSKFPVEVSISHRSIGGNEYILAIAKDISERKLAEEKLRKSEEELSSIASTMPQGLYLFDLIEQRTVYSNREIWRDLGYDEKEGAELGPYFMQKLLHPEDLERLPALIKRWDTLADGEVLETVYRMRHKSGQWRWFLGRDTVFKRTGSGKVCQFIGTAQDITERKLAEEELLLMQQAVEHSSDAMFFVRQDASFSYANPKATTLLGYSNAELIHMSVPDIDPNFPHEVWQHHWEEIRQSGHRSFETIHRRRNGDLFDVEMRVFSIESQNEPLIVGCARDITVRKKAQHLLRTHNEVLEQLATGHAISLVLESIALVIEEQFDCVRVAIMQVEGNLMRCAAAPNLPPDYVSFLDGQPISSESCPCVSAATQKRNVLLDNCFHDQTWDTCNLLAQAVGLRASWSHPILTENGEVLGTLVFYACDFEEPAEKELEIIESFARLASIAIQRRRIEEALKLRDDELAHVGRLAMLGEVVAELTHEINQPLYTIANFAQACINEASNPDRGATENLREWLVNIRQATTRASEILSRTSEFTRRGSRRVISCNVHDLIVQTLDLISWRLTRQEISVNYEPPQSPTYCTVDRIQIEQVLLNLLVNSCDAIQQTGALGRIAIHVEVAEDTLEIIVEDNGPGIPESIRNKLFDPFVTTKSEGMGLGLAISRSIVEDHRGRISVDDQCTGGARFHVRLPLPSATETVE